MTETTVIKGWNCYLLSYGALMPLIVFPSLVLCYYSSLAAWVFMWLFALALFAGCKWLTFAEARKDSAASNYPRAIAYLFCWPGMDAANFLDPNRLGPKPPIVSWILAVVNILSGMALVWMGARPGTSDHLMIAGWIGMAGIVFILHFGFFQLLALYWQSAGVNATPLMCNPLISKSLAEFWGRRWNTAFHALAHRYTFRPLARRIGVTGATLAGFLVSGLVHELVISLPAHGGYGLPTAYFLIQGLGVIIERSALGRNLRLAHGTRGWLFMLLVTAVPSVWLFHPPFVLNVIVPMLRAIIPL